MKSLEFEYIAGQNGKEVINKVNEKDDDWEIVQWNYNSDGHLRSVVLQRPNSDLIAQSVTITKDEIEKYSNDGWNVMHWSDDQYRATRQILGRVLKKEQKEAEKEIEIKRQQDLEALRLAQAREQIRRQQEQKQEQSEFESDEIEIPVEVMGEGPVSIAHLNTGKPLSDPFKDIREQLQ